MILSGTAVRAEQVLVLANLLGSDPLAEKLTRAVQNDNSIVALSIEDRHRIVSVLDKPSFGLSELKSVLVAQLKKHKERELQHERSRLSQQIARRRDDRTGPSRVSA